MSKNVETYANRLAVIGPACFEKLGKTLNAREIANALAFADENGVGDAWADQRVIDVLTGVIPSDRAGEEARESYLMNQVVESAATHMHETTTSEKRLAQKIANFNANVAAQQAHVSDLLAELKRLCTEKGIPVPETPAAAVIVPSGDSLTDALAELAAVSGQFAVIGDIVQGVRGESGQTFGPPPEPEPPTESGTPLPLPDGTLPGPGGNRG